MADERETERAEPTAETAATAGRTDLDQVEPNEGYGILPDATDEELRDAFRRAEPDPGGPADSR